MQKTRGGCPKGLLLFLRRNRRLRRVGRRAAGKTAASERRGKMKLNITGKSTIVMKAAKTSTAKKPKAVRDAVRDAEGKKPAGGR